MNHTYILTDSYDPTPLKAFSSLEKVKDYIVETYPHYKENKLKLVETPDVPNSYCNEDASIIIYKVEKYLKQKVYTFDPEFFTRRLFGEYPCTPRVFGAIRNYFPECENIEDLKQITGTNFLRCPNAGRKAWEELKVLIEEHES